MRSIYYLLSRHDIQAAISSNRSTPAGTPVMTDTRKGISKEAEKAAEIEAVTWVLSDREKEIIKELSQNESINIREENN